ncbi:MAG: NUDIX domain-containing protein [Rickettsiales bacterium]|jgi:8-oxo-dGTP pyrophosphatase MutT (NUDIX family)|nr:NUDIX domain-containing protein [Rickettsiales bacterium]
MSEMLDVYDANKKLVGTADRAVVHAFGLWHKTIHCWLAVGDKMVFQRRSALKEENAGKLYTTASGHVAAGETIAQAFAREIAQEIGFKIDNAEFIQEGPWVADIVKKDGSLFVDRVFANLYCALLDDLDWNKIKFDDGEVDAMAAIDARDFLQLAAGDRAAVRAQIWDGKNLVEKEIKPTDFVVNSGETLLGKYGKIAEFIMEKRNGKS